MRLMTLSMVLMIGLTVFVKLIVFVLAVVAIPVRVEKEISKKILKIICKVESLTIRITVWIWLEIIFCLSHITYYCKHEEALKSQLTLGTNTGNVLNILIDRITRSRYAQDETFDEVEDIDGTIDTLVNQRVTYKLQNYFILKT